MKNLSKSNNKGNKRKDINGFTLIELLATIAILSIVLSISVYFAYDIVDNANKKSYQVTISNIEKTASTYVLENVSSVKWIDSNDMSYQYQCVFVYNLIDTGYFSGDILNSKINKDTNVRKDDIVYLERNINNKVITNSVLLVGDRVDYVNSLCGNVSGNTEGNITFKIEPNGFTKEKNITVYYRISNNTDYVSNYVYDYEYDTIDLKKSSSFSSRTHQEEVKVNKNGNLVAQIKNGDNLIVSNIQEISQIDDVLPSVNIKDNSANVSNIQNVLLEMSDSESGLDEYYFGKESSSLNVDSWITTTGNQTGTVSEAGKYYLIVRDKVGNEVINEKEFYKTTLSIENAKLTYDNLITIDGKEFTIPLPEVDEGYYFVGWYKKSDYSGDAITNYSPTGNSTLYGKVIKKVTIPVASAYCNSGLIYNGKEQELTKSSESWYTFINNTEIEAGSYTVTARLNGDYIWDDNSKSDKTLTCSISKANITPTVTIGNYTYGGTKGSPSISGNSGNGTVTYYYNTKNSNSGGTTWSSVANAKSLNAGTYYMYAKVSETKNYNSSTTAAVSFVIDKASCTCAISLVPTDMKYPIDKERNITYSCGGDGTIGVTSGTTSVITSGTAGILSTKLTAVDVGSSVITVSMDAGTNYNACTSDSTTVAVKDGVEPTCTISVSTSNISMAVNDNVGITKKGLSTSTAADYNGETELSLTKGTIYGYVQDAAGNTGSCSVDVTSTVSEYTCSIAATKENSTTGCTASNYTGKCPTTHPNYDSSASSCQVKYTVRYAKCFMDPDRPEFNDGYTWRIDTALSKFGLSSCNKVVSDGDPCTYDDYYNQTQKIAKCEATYSGVITCYRYKCSNGTLNGSKCYLYNQNSCSNGWDWYTSSSYCADSSYTRVSGKSYCYKIIN